MSKNLIIILSFVGLLKTNKKLINKIYLKSNFNKNASYDLITNLKGDIEVIELSLIHI